MRWEPVGEDEGRARRDGPATRDTGVAGCCTRRRAADDGPGDPRSSRSRTGRFPLRSMVL